MAEASEMSMSMSVQSAWEDLVVENPNRAKLEGCLLTTIMLVVCCIIALLVYVFVQLQPQGNVVMRAPFWKTNFFDQPADRQFALRMLGWMNWSATRCMDFPRWACGGRAVEASSLAIYETAETAAEDYAAEYALELIERSVGKHLKEPTEDIPNHKYDSLDFKNMVTFLDKCRYGTPNATEFIIKLAAIWKTRAEAASGGDKGNAAADVGFVSEASSGSYVAYIQAFGLLQFFPFGEQYLTTKDDADSKIIGEDKLTTVHPPRLIGTENDPTFPPFEKVMRGGMKTIASLSPKMCCGENGKQIVEVEKEIAGWFQDDEKIMDVGGADNIKIDKTMKNMCDEISATKCRFLDKKIPFGYGKVAWPAKGSNFINWMWLKFFILLAPLLPLEDPALAEFLPLVAWYHRRAELPHRDILCMKIVEHYFRDTVHTVLSEDKYLTDVTATMNEALDKLKAELSAAGGKGPALTVFTLQLNEAKHFSDVVKKHGEMVNKFFTAGMNRTVFFFTKAPEKLTRTEYADPLDILSEQAEVLKEHRAKGTPTWVGPTFRAEAIHDPLKDVIFVPLGLAMPPFFHNDTEKIKHAVPGYLPKLLKPLLERFMKGFFLRHRALNLKSFREPELSINLPAKFMDPASKHSLEAATCFKKQYGPRMMWDLYYERSAVQFSYHVYRTGFNHAKENKDLQLRLGYLKFISEEMIFFITAANAFCHTAHPSLASPKDQEQAPKRVALVMHCKLLGQSMLCDKRRDLFKAPCNGMINDLAQRDEALWTVEAWRNAKKVILE